MELLFWGARGSIPNFTKQKVHFGVNTSCVEMLDVPGHRIIFDAGTGIVSLGNIVAQKKDPTPKVVHIILSHFHWDHIQGLPFFKPAFSPDSEIHIYGKPGLEKVLSRQMTAPFSPVTIDMLPASIHLHTVREPFDIESVHIHPFWLHHPQGCLGFRISMEEKTWVYATDTEPDGGELDEALLRDVEGADLLVMDANFMVEEAPLRKGWGHSTWEDACLVSKKAGVKKLALFHHDPFHEDDLIFQKERQAQALFPRSLAAFEGLKLAVGR